MAITGLGANDFVDFLLSYFVDLGLIMLFRVNIDPTLSDILEIIRLTYVEELISVCLLNVPSMYQADAMLLSNGFSSPDRQTLLRLTYARHALCDQFAIVACAFRDQIRLSQAFLQKSNACVAGDTHGRSAGRHTPTG